MASPAVFQAWVFPLVQQGQAEAKVLLAGGPKATEAQRAAVVVATAIARKVLERAAPLEPPVEPLLWAWSPIASKVAAANCMD